MEAAIMSEWSVLLVNELRSELYCIISQYT